MTYRRALVANSVFSVTIRRMFTLCESTWWWIKPVRHSPASLADLIQNADVAHADESFMATILPPSVARVMPKDAGAHRQAQATSRSCAIYIRSSRHWNSASLGRKAIGARPKAAAAASAAAACAGSMRTRVVKAPGAGTFWHSCG